MRVVTFPTSCEAFHIEVRAELRVVVATFTGPVLRMRDADPERYACGQEPA